ncbi:hypothetical protein RF11_14070 [Thelohanellus kitauei]|uniref:Uncharacterized protein n=1 Tax=Thelohanellus kitauei TaxID=669202 RepID=A0A0C2III7_THEKT|nr:hypothetical protein RF11_14070 [Thelohanellus kitauei]
MIAVPVYIETVAKYDLKDGIRLNFTTAYHPQSNGLALLHNDEWTDHFPWVLLGLRNTQKEDLKVSPVELVFGSQVSLSCDFSTTTPDDVDVTTFVNKFQKITNVIRYTESSDHNTKRKYYLPSDILKRKFVFIRADNCRKPFGLVYEGPLRVIRTVQNFSKGIIEQPEQPKRRGRPIKQALTMSYTAKEVCGDHAHNGS